jgi:glutamate-ammonia-ligase adenylyltransferase
VSTDIEQLTIDLPDPESARRFLVSFEDQYPRDSVKLRKNEGLLSDVLTLASYSPLLATTMLQNPDHVWWLNRKRAAPAVRTKEELLEGLARFVLTHSQIDLHTQLARFRRRELLRIFLSDIRRLTTIAEITEDISNLADAILETALRDARQEMDNRFGQPQTVDNKGRKTPAEFCIVSLGKLGSRELNYSSDIDLLFLYSAEGETSGRGMRGAVTNREYFVKLAELVSQMVGRQSGEGAAYRVDMRLRPHGRVGPLSISVADAVRYYVTEARDWERQVLIRSRSSAGNPEMFKDFFEQVEPVVFVGTANSGETSEPSSAFPNPQDAIREALESVRRSKQLIDHGQKPEPGFNVKLGRGGIREIEFIAQALQLAYGGDDRWLRAPHTLISLSRISDRGHITEGELTELYNAYEFLRHLEHILQMENGLQTHHVPSRPERRALVARRMRAVDVEAFEHELAAHTRNVHRVFARVFETELVEATPSATVSGPSSSDPVSNATEEIATAASTAGKLHSEPGASGLSGRPREIYRANLAEAVDGETDFRHRMGAFRKRWSELLEEIKASDIGNETDLSTAKREQTALAEASIDTALDIARVELTAKYGTEIESLPLAVMGLGKLGGGAIDYGSDLDLVLVYDQDARIPDSSSAAEFYDRAAQIFVTTLSSMTRDGSIYRVDLRLRPYGKNGTSAISASAFKAYMSENAAIWEWLAYVKVRAVAGEIRLAADVEKCVRGIIHSRAGTIDAEELAAETLRIRTLLEQQKARTRRSGELDIKYGPGGMLDVYFAMRFLQLRDNIPDSSDNRSTEFTLGVLHEKGSLTASDHRTMIDGYRFLSNLDHGLRLTVGRTTKLPAGNSKALEIVARRMQLASTAELFEQLTLHRLGVRSAFEKIVSF